MSLKPLATWYQKSHGYILILRDITDQKEQENMRRDMIHNLVHDLRAPLSNSMFALQMLETQLNEQALPEAVRMVEMTIRNTEKTLDRVNEILDVERLDSHQIPLALSAVSLPEVINNVLAAQALRIMAKKLDVVSYVPDSLTLVWADGSLLERILQNLVDNSIKFTPSGGEIMITVTAVPHTDPPTVHITISDTGTGIPAQLQATVFDKYMGTIEKGSSGLGLAFCKMALVAHGQAIWVESQPGHGACFTFSLALATQPHHHYSQRLAARMEA
jgi:signal transduction histidine kinase